MRLIFQFLPAKTAISNIFNKDQSSPSRQYARQTRTRLQLETETKSEFQTDIGTYVCKNSSVRPKPLFWFMSDTGTETQIGRYFRPIP